MRYPMVIISDMFDKNNLVPYNTTVISKDAPSPKTPIKGKLLCKLTDRYPSIDVSSVQVMSHIQAIGKHLSMILNNELSEHGLTEGKFYVLAFLFSEELLGHEVPSPSQIADHVGVTRGTVTGLLDGLERDEFIRRSHDTRDRRALNVQITEKGRTFLDGFLPIIAGNFERFIPLTFNERELVIDLLAKIDLSLSEVTSQCTTCITH